MLVTGDLVLAEPAARKIADDLAKKSGCEIEIRRRPLGLDAILADLKTFSLFGGGKVVMVIDSAALADRNAAADLIDEASEALPLGQKGGTLTGREREAASRLLQAVRLFGADPEAADPVRVLAELPAWAFQGGASYR